MPTTPPNCKEWTVRFAGKVYLFVGTTAPVIEKVEDSTIRGIYFDQLIIDEVLPMS